MSMKELLLNGLITKMKTFDEIIEVIKDYLSNQEAVIMYEKKIQTRLNSYMPLTGKTREGL